MLTPLPLYYTFFPVLQLDALLERPDERLAERLGLRLDGLLERPDGLLVVRLGLLLAGLLQLLRLLRLQLLRLV